MTPQYYIKQGRRYVPVQPFTGFPADGIWLCTGGQSRWTNIVMLNEKIPTPYVLNYRVWEDGLTQAMMGKAKDSWCWADMARLAADFFAEKATSGAEALEDCQGGSCGL